MIMSAVDTNGDGRLSTDELATMIIAMLVEGGFVLNETEQHDHVVREFVDYEVKLALKHDANFDGEVDLQGLLEKLLGLDGGLAPREAFLPFLKGVGVGKRLSVRNLGWHFRVFFVGELETAELTCDFCLDGFLGLSF